MSFNVVIVIQENPFTTHRPVEGLRIALGLSTGFPSLKIIILNQALVLLTDEVGEIMDGEILEKYMPTIQNLCLPIFIARESAKEFQLNLDLNISQVSPEHITTIIRQADRAIIF